MVKTPSHALYDDMAAAMAHGRSTASLQSMLLAHLAQGADPARQVAKEDGIFGLKETDTLLDMLVRHGKVELLATCHARFPCHPASLSAMAETAIRHHQAAVLDWVMSAGLSPLSPIRTASELEQPFKNGTALFLPHLAIHYRATGWMARLHARGVDLQALTPPLLHAAAYQCATYYDKQSLAIMEELLSEGFEANTQARNGLAALDIFAGVLHHNRKYDRQPAPWEEENLANVLDLLLDAGADPFRNPPSRRCAASVLEEALPRCAVRLARMKKTHLETVIPVSILPARRHRM